MKKLIFSVSVFAAVLLSFLPLAAQTTISSSGNVTGAAEGINDVSATLKDTDGRRIVSATASGYSGKTGEVVNDAMAKTGDAQRSVPQYLSYTLILSGEIVPNKGGGEFAGEGGPETYSATRLEKGEFYIDQSEKYIAQGKTAKFTARRTNDKTPIPVEWKITTKDGIQVQPTTGTISATEITTLSTLTAQEYIVTATDASGKAAMATFVICGIIFQKQSAGESVFSDISSGADLFISAGDATHSPEFPTIRVKYTGILNLYRSLQYGVQKGTLTVITPKNEVNYGTIKGTDDTKEILAGVAVNGGVIRFLDNQEFGLIVKYKFEGENEEKKVKFNMKGNNPTIASVKSFIDARRNSLTVTYNRQAIDMTSYYEKIITHESNFQQFNDRGTYSGEPNYGAPNGWGIAQIDNGTGNYNTNYMWNWHENLQAGISIFAGKVGGINDRIRWIRNEYPDLPPLTDEQFIRAMIIAYNGFRGTHQVRTGYDDFGNPTYISFCYEPISRNQWGNFRDNENNYYSVIANTSVP